MKVVIPEDITDIEQAQTLIRDLQVRLFAREQALDDLVRAVEIAEVTRQFQLVTGFREAAEEQLKDRLTLPEANDSEDMKITIYQ